MSWIVAIVGPPGAGKGTVGKLLAQAIQARSRLTVPIVSCSGVIARVAKEHGADVRSIAALKEFGSMQDAASPGWVVTTGFNKLLAEPAYSHSASREVVIFDGLIRPSEASRLRELAAERGSDSLIGYIDAPAEICVARLNKRKRALDGTGFTEASYRTSFIECERGEWLASLRQMSDLVFVNSSDRLTECSGSLYAATKIDNLLRSVAEQFSKAA